MIRTMTRAAGIPTILLATLALAAGVATSGPPAHAGTLVREAACNDVALVGVYSGPSCTINMPFNSLTKNSCWAPNLCVLRMSNRSVGTGFWDSHVVLEDGIRYRTCPSSSVSSATCAAPPFYFASSVYWLQDDVLTVRCSAPSVGVALLMEIDCSVRVETT